MESIKRRPRFNLRVWEYMISIKTLWLQLWKDPQVLDFQNSRESHHHLFLQKPDLHINKILTSPPTISIIAYKGGENFTIKLIYEKAHITIESSLKLSSRPLAIKVSHPPYFSSSSSIFVLDWYWIINVPKNRFGQVPIATCCPTF